MTTTTFLLCWFLIGSFVAHQWDKKHNILQSEQSKTTATKLGHLFGYIFTSAIWPVLLFKL